MAKRQLTMGDCYAAADALAALARPEPSAQEDRHPSCIECGNDIMHAEGCSRG